MNFQMTIPDPVSIARQSMPAAAAARLAGRLKVAAIGRAG
jgi:hypothetical protein